MIEARAWLELGQYDHALEIIEGDKRGDASRRARRDRLEAARLGRAPAPQFEGQLGDRWKNPAPLSADEEGRLLRAGVAYSLAGDDAGLARLREHYQGFVAHAQQPDALRVALAGLAAGAGTSSRLQPRRRRERQLRRLGARR